ncbi:MAG: hypothetical protein R6X25_12550 [Candidatus Krumholzibacteriia bacterium]
MSDKKKSAGKKGQGRPETDAEAARGDAEAPPLSELEVELSLICLRYFRGDWDMYLDYLQGSRVTDGQRRREIPLVEQLRDRDRRTEYLTYFLEDEVVSVLQQLEFQELLHLWEESILLHPDSDPFPDDANSDDEESARGESARDLPPTMH